MQRFAVNLSETHGIAVQHSREVCPTTLVQKLGESCGKVSSSSSFVLRDGDSLMTLIFFSEPDSADSCFQFLHMPDNRSSLQVTNAGWINENGIGSFARKSYVKEKWTVPTTCPPQSRGNEGEEEESSFLIVFWASVTSHMTRDSIEKAAKQWALEMFRDDKEGGRLFIRLADSKTEDCRRALLSTFDLNARHISYGDANDFAAAQKAL